MARIEWVRQRLENWSRWCLQQDGHGLGYPSMSAFARLGGLGSRAEAVIPISSIDAGEIDQAVKSLLSSQSHLYRTLVLHYAKGYQVHMVAIKLGRAESTVRKNLEDADYALVRYLQDRRAMQERHACAK